MCYIGKDGDERVVLRVPPLFFLASGRTGGALRSRAEPPGSRSTTASRKEERCTGQHAPDTLAA